MNIQVTRNVVHDLWPLCKSGDASPDSRALVDAYLASDTEFAAQLKEIDTMTVALPNVTLSPDTERRLLGEARSKARTRMLLVGGGLVIALFALSVVAVVFLTSARF
jgi:ferric-dicitrate binding protein FerR (iron transport regulator)